MRRNTFLGLIALALPAFGAETIDFNRQIRPLLSDKCFLCHGPDATTRKTKLRFDQESSARAAIVSGNLLARVTSTNQALRMPPAYLGKDALTPAEIQLLRAWIEQGAPWQAFWSFVPPQRPVVPAGANAIDHFIRARLDREGLSASVEAAKGTLLRRVSFDLTGLPPTPVELQAFLNDPGSKAYEKQVDRLLASPRYGERMAFRWMEAARYGDTNGYQTDGPRDMYRWRDWVIDAYNGNMPYSRFVTEQIAGDLLPNATVAQHVATGFNRNHRTNGEGGIIPEEYRVEYVADRVQTTSTVFLGLTVGCARCHDHKYDPISQKDFYSLFAYFNQIPNEQGFAWNYGNEDPNVKAPMPEQLGKLAELDRILAAAKRNWESRNVRATSNPLSWTVTRNRVFDRAEEQRFDGKNFFEQKDGKAANFDYLQPFTYSVWIKPESLTGGVMSHADDFGEGSGHGLYLHDGRIRFYLLRRWTDLGIREETTSSVKAGMWQQITVTYDGRRKAAGLHIYLDGVPQPVDVSFDQNAEPINFPDLPIRIGAAGPERFTGSIRDARIYNDALTMEEIIAIAKPDSAEHRMLAYLNTDASAAVKHARADYLNALAARARFYDEIPSVMTMRDGANRPNHLLKRGAYDDHGEPVAAAIPAVFKAPEASDRLALAKWLTGRNNPLTARVAVNRLWQSFFGFGIVKTVDDFGSQGEWPVHPELLDWLAVEFMESGWNLKAIQKTIVMSQTYRQQSNITPAMLQRDPDNRLLARGPRYRLGPEEIRDQALLLSGALVEKLGGPSVKPYQPPGLWQDLSGGKGYIEDTGEGLHRRSLYTYWKRTVAPPYMINFDSPNRETCTVWENRTNSPLQALNLMNDITFLEASRKLAARIAADGGATPAEQIDYAFRLMLAKEPTREQRRIFQNAYEKFRGDWTALASILLNSDEVISKQ